MPDDGQTTKSSASQISPTRTEAKPLSVADMLQEKGNTGVYVVNGFLEKDYNAKLSGKVGLDTYDKMRKSDATVSALLDIITLPIRSTEWYVEPGKNEEGLVTEVEEEIADFVHRALFEKLEQGWDDYLREVLSCTWAGHSVFEKVYEADDEHVWLKKIAFRKQSTILRWEQSDGTPGITQVTPTAAINPNGQPSFNIDIPAQKLLIFTFKREGDNYEGISLLRPAYKHWYIKDTLYKFDSVRHERQSVGVPYIKLPDNASTDDIAAARSILKNFRAHEMSGVVMPNSKWEFGFCDLKAGDVSDLWKSIEHHNREILKVGLAQFLELGGSAKSGSRAVSTDQSGLFLQAIDALCKMVDDVHSRFLFPELVDLNFDNVFRYPRLRHRRLEKLDSSALATIMQTLVAAGIVTPDKGLEEWTRKVMDLPPQVEEEIPTNHEPQDELPEEEIPLGDLEPIGEGDVNPDDIIDPNAEPIEEEESEDDTVDPAEIDELLKTNKKATFYETDTQVFAEIDGNFYLSDGLKFRIVSEETKKKISDALKARYGTSGKADVPQKRVTNVAQRVGEKRAVQQKAPAAARPTTAGKLATKTDKSGKIKIKAEGNPRQKLMALRKYMQSAKDPKQKAAAVTALKDLQSKLQPRIAKQSKSIVDKAKKATTKKPKATKKATKAPKIEKTKPAIKKAIVKKPVALKAHEHGHDDAQEYISLVNYQSIKAIQLQSMNLTFEEARLPDHLHVKQFAEPYTSWRPLTFAEQKVNFTPLKKALDTANAKLEVQLNAITSDQKADLLNQIKRAVEANDIAAVGKIRARYTGELSSALTEVQKQMFEYGMKSAAGELKVKIPPTAAEIKGVMRVQTDKLSQKMADDMTHAATGAVSQLATKNAGSITNTGTAEAISAASQAIDKVIAKKAVMKTLSVIGTLNLGRATIFERYPEQVYAMQYSAIIDGRTTDLCLSLDGRIVKPGSDEFYNYAPPQHENCRSIWVEILQDEEFKPDIDGIPSSIKSNIDLTQFEDIEAPIIKSNSPAIKLIKQELDDRKDKLKQYQDADMYPNRQATHQERIDALQKSIPTEDDE